MPMKLNQHTYSNGCRSSHPKVFLTKLFSYQSHHQLQEALDVGLATKALVVRPAADDGFICYMSKRTLWASACVAKPTSSASSS